ncbi:hypothetical protein HY441_01170 [Candidatus Microgenomates bacterium]|nr:hypothetical protein [Candidatus Microgenomates bacterium]
MEERVKCGLEDVSEACKDSKDFCPVLRKVMAAAMIEDGVIYEGEFAKMRFDELVQALRERQVFHPEQCSGPAGESGDWKCPVIDSPTKRIDSDFLRKYTWYDGGPEETREVQGTPDLFEQTKDLTIVGERLSGEAEILHEIEDYFRMVEFYPIVRDQIQGILESVPRIFPEDWQSPESFDDLDENQQDAYLRIAKAGLQPCPGPIMQKVIELAIELRARHT